MNRSEYDDEGYTWQYIKYRGTVTPLKELLDVLDALEVKELYLDSLKNEFGYCALDTIFKLRNLDFSKLDNQDLVAAAKALEIAELLAREIVYINNEFMRCSTKTIPIQRWFVVRRWVASKIKKLQ